MMRVSSTPKSLETEKAKAEMFSAISHELRNPLSSIKMAVDIVKSKALGELTDQQVDVLSKATDHIERLNRTITDIGFFLKITSANLDFNFQDNLIVDILREISDLSLEKFKNQKNLIKLEVPDSTIKVSCDKDRIKQALKYLIQLNIVYAQGDQIEVKGEEADDGYSIFIKNKSIVLDESFLRSPFELFQPLGGLNTDKNRPSGVEMALCQIIFDKHGVELVLHSDEKEGTLFLIKLPKC